MTTASMVRLVNLVLRENVEREVPAARSARRERKVSASAAHLDFRVRRDHKVKMARKEQPGQPDHQEQLELQEHQDLSDLKVPKERKDQSDLSDKQENQVNPV